MPGKLMKPKAVADLTGFHPRTISEMGKRGDIPGAVLIGKHVRFHAQSVHAFLEQGGQLGERDVRRAANFPLAPSAGGRV